MRYDCFPAQAPTHRGGSELVGLGRARGCGRVTGCPAWWHPSRTGSTRRADRPRPMQVVAYTKFSCSGRQTAQTSVYWAAPSGAGVFTAGTMDWPCAARSLCTLPQPARTAALLSRVTRNILTAFAVPRVGRCKRPLDTVGTFWLPTPDDDRLGIVRPACSAHPTSNDPTSEQAVKRLTA